MVRRLDDITGNMATQITKTLDEQHWWFHQLGAEDRSWINLVAQAGVSGFARWFADDDENPVDPGAIFNVAPKELARKITLRQTVDLIRTTIKVVEEQIITQMPRGDRTALGTAIVVYSRDVAFAAAEIYAKAAESRGTWAEHTELLIIDSLINGEPDSTLVSRASTVGWPVNAPACVVIGGALSTEGIAALRQATRKAGLNVLAAAHGTKLVAVLAGESLNSSLDVLATVESLKDHFAPGRIIISSLADSLATARVSASEALAGAEAEIGFQGPLQVIEAAALLPERALNGDPLAKNQLINSIYLPLLAAGGDLLETTTSFFEHGSSIEASARALYVHANTIRYRIKRVQEVIGYSPTNPREAYCIQIALTLGRMQPPGPPAAESKGILGVSEEIKKRIVGIPQMFKAISTRTAS
jgi:hypothetical protein